SGKDFGRLGGKTLLYYMTTSLLAIMTGLIAVNIFQPGTNAKLGLQIPDKFEPAAGSSFADVLTRMVPSNIFEALGQNGQMLQIIVFALIFGFFAARTPAPHGPRVIDFFKSAFEIMMRMADWVLSLIPYGVFALMVKVVGETGLEPFKDLLLFMLLVTGTLLVHAMITLPILLKVLGGLSPIKWAKAMSPALMTAFSSSSSSMTLPVSMEAAERRGGVSNRITSFVLPLGATINMDGTALYECVGVIFLSQYYAAHSVAFDLTLGMQFFVVITALLASVGAAGIPSAGLVLKAMILKALGLPDDGVLLLLAIDRPLDMLRTTVNVWSDSCGAAIIGRSEGDKILAESSP
ncbi:MAG: dicarboxylate/amino acid:cation symporter, partial [Planctomycetes bacterium]|nr:dicarboxylate/amino acid:cation symporter [Planctomycetota bacterium]